MRCGDCNERMSVLDVATHECRGRFCRLHCGDCGELVDADRVDDHVCTGRRETFFNSAGPAAPAQAGQGQRWAPALSKLRGRGPPYLLEDVHARLELLCLELDAVGGTALPWWELATPDAHEELAVTPACGSNLESASSGALTRAR